MGTIALALLLAVVPPPARGAPGDDCRNAAGVLAPPKTEDVEEVVRAILAHRDRIPLSQHARDAIEKKNITVPQVMDVLKRGVRAPEEERPAHKRLTHVFEGQPEGQEGVLRVVVGLMDDGFPLVVTVMRVWGDRLKKSLERLEEAARPAKERTAAGGR